MKTDRLDARNDPAAAISRAAEILRAGGIVAIPTETVYGLAARADNPKAISDVFAAKGRPQDNPLIVHISDLSELDGVARDIPQTAFTCAGNFWPGPFTMILPRGAEVDPQVSAGLETVAVRMPSDNIARAIIRAAGPLAAPSANTSGKPSPTTAERVLEDLDGKIDAVVLAGECTVGVESTVVSLVARPPRLLRPGGVTAEQLRELIPELEIDAAVMSEPKSGERVASPGMKYKHYAPKADFTMFDGDIDKVADRINELAESYIKKGYKVGIISSAESKDRYRYGEVISIGSRNNELSISKNLYKVLREFDDKQVDYILGETFRSEELGQAIMNRLLKAAGYQVETVI